MNSILESKASLTVGAVGMEIFDKYFDDGGAGAMPSTLEKDYSFFFWILVVFLIFLIVIDGIILVVFVMK